MALTRCKECGAEISTTADACPKCGAKCVRTSGCAKVALGAILFLVFLGVLGQCSRDGSSNSSASTAPTDASITPSAPAPHDDLSLFISKFGEPDRVESSENETPRPPIVTKQLIYGREGVRVVYVVDGEVGGAPPYKKWKLLGFQDDRTGAVLQPAEAMARLEGRKRQ